MNRRIPVISLSKKVNLTDGVLVSRHLAKQMYEVSRQEIGNLISNDILIFDFKGIFDCSSSFIDEFILVWQRFIRNFSSAMLVLTNMNDDVLFTVESALNQRNRISKENLSLLAYYKGKLIVLGDKLERNSLQVFEHIIYKEYITAREVADLFNLELNNAGNRLKKLYDARVIMRVEQSSDLGGKFKYFIPRL